MNTLSMLSHVMFNPQMLPHVIPQAISIVISQAILHQPIQYVLSPVMLHQPIPYVLSQMLPQMLPQAILHQPLPYVLSAAPGTNLLLERNKCVSR